MFHRSGFENTRPDGFPVLEVAPGDGTPADGRPQFVPLRRSAITGEILGPVADLTLTQTFSYSSAECSRVLEALYRFPLPGDAAVTGVRVTFGDVTIEALLKERHQAEADYEAARESGRQAALTTRESPDVFTVHLAGLHPDQEVHVETRYVQQARADGAGWSLRIPLTTSPRYVREQESGRHTAGQPLALLRDPGHRFSLDLLFSGTPAVTCSTHPLASRTTEAGARISLQEGEVLPDRDCVLHWIPPRDQHRPSIQGLAHHTAGADSLYFLALVSPPAAPNAAAAVPREVILLVDHSGSMSGAKWDAADWAVKQFLAGLGPNDRFNLCLFHSTTRWYAGKMREATPAVVQDAIAFLERHRDSGGTELGTALEQALGQNRAVGDIARHLLIVTDAEVSDAARLCEMADHESARPDRRRISVLCIDAAPNSYLASELAERGGGVARFLTSSPEEEDITTALDALLADWAQPVLTGMRLEVNRPQVVAAGRAVESGPEPGWSAVDLGDLPAGRTVWVAGRAPASGAPDLTFRLVAGGRRLAQARMPLAMCGERPALRALFGARRVLALEHIYSQTWSEVSPADVLRRLGYGPKEVFSGAAALAAEQVRGNRSDEIQSGLRTLLVREALDYGLICAETAFVATRQEAGKPVEETVLVPNALPSGWSETFAGGPPTGGALYCMAAPASPPAMSPLPSPARASGLGGLVRGLTRGMAMRNQPSGPADVIMEAAAPPDSPEDVPAFLRAPRRRSASQPPDLRSGKPAPEPDLFAGKPAGPGALFSGEPVFRNGAAVLFDTDQESDAEKLPTTGIFSRLELRLIGASAVDAGAVLLLFVDDMLTPRARVRVADLLRQGGTRPVNVRRTAGTRVRVVLEDPGGAWPIGAGVEVHLH